MRRVSDLGDPVAATAAYETWLGRYVRLLAPDLERKHDAMAAGLFPFFRATFYLWVQRWPRVCPDLAHAPPVLAVGDLHVENFGTWRDQEGRLIWGVNDFDEAWRLPYTNDLLRLATSVLIAGEEHDLETDGGSAIEALLDGYASSLEVGGQPFVLAEHSRALGEMAADRLHDPKQFWRKLTDLSDVVGKVPAGALKAIREAMPQRTKRIRLVHRVSGLGSLGRERVVGIGEWEGGLVAREAKALAPSAAARKVPQPRRRTWIVYQDTLRHVIRCPDPTLRVLRRWIVRRLAPDCCRLELGALPRRRDEIELLRAMGWETANVHLGTERAKILRADLKSRPKAWLSRAARKMYKVMRADWETWRRDYKP